MDRTQGRERGVTYPTSGTFGLCLRSLIVVSRYKSAEGMQYRSWKLQHWDCDLQQETLTDQHLLHPIRSQVQERTW